LRVHFKAGRPRRAGLCREVLQQRNLLVGERSDLRAAGDDVTEQSAFSTQRQHQNRTQARVECGSPYQVV